PIPDQYALHQNYPNPFNPVTTIEYDLPENVRVSLSVYDVLGREITHLVNADEVAGYHQVQWNGTDAQGRNVSSGMYFIRLVAGKYHSVKKMVLLK
ncbi:MAG: T9SS type A sorting domain-containing protein, partial [Fidelibacterota bacterium]